MIMHLKVTNTLTGMEWIEENKPHSWESLCLDIMKHHKKFCLVWCDIEGLFTFNGGTEWAMADECGNWDFLPDEYVVEEICDNNFKIAGKKK